MENPPNPPEDDRQTDLGEDHREGQPGYDLDEQQAIEELQEERDDE